MRPRLPHRSLWVSASRREALNGLAFLRVLFDSQIFCSQRFGGISRYFAALAREIHCMPGAVSRIEAPAYINEYLDTLPRSVVSGRQVPAFRGMWPLSYFASRLLSYGSSARFKPDVLHQTFYYQRRGSSSLPTVTTIHDMIHEKYPAGLSGARTLSRLKKARVIEADRVICVSENTKRDVLECYGVDERKVMVVYHGYDSLYPQLDISGDQYRKRLFNSEEPYLLFVGVRVGYKNFEGLIEAVSTSVLLKKECRVLCFGGGAFSSRELELLDNNGLRDRVVQIQGSDSDLADAYAHALLMVYPSRYEGFGLPPIEAMSLSCPVACSNTGSLPEVVGSAARMFNPEEPDEFRYVLESLVKSADERARLIDLGLDRCKQFSWRKCAADTLNVYRSLA